MAFLPEADWEAYQARKRKAQTGQGPAPSSPPGWPVPPNPTFLPPAPPSPAPTIGASGTAGLTTLPSGWMPPVTPYEPPARAAPVPELPPPRSPFEGWRPPAEVATLPLPGGADTLASPFVAPGETVPGNWTPASSSLERAARDVEPWATAPVRGALQFATNIMYPAQHYVADPISGLAEGGAYLQGMPAQPAPANPWEALQQKGEEHRFRQEQGRPRLPLGDIPMFWGPGELQGAASLAGRGAGALAKGTRAVAPKVGEALGELATGMRRAPQAGSVAVELPGAEKAAAKAAPARRFYHGTGSAFDSPDAGHFDPDGMYGPGYYLTSNPEVASNYAKTRAGGASEPTGANVRAVDVLDGLRLLDVEAPIPATTLRAAFNAMGIEYLEPDLVIQSIPDVWNPAKPTWKVIDKSNARIVGEYATEAEARNAVQVGVPQTYKRVQHDLMARGEGEADSGATKEAFNRALQDVGYDGIRYQGGKRNPLLDDAGRPIMHEAFVIFPESLPKIRNAISGLPMGSYPEIGGALAGGYSGAVTAPEGATPEEIAQRTLLGMAGGALGMGGARLGAKALAGSERAQEAGRLIGQAMRDKPEAGALRLRGGGPPGPEASANAANATLGKMYAAPADPPAGAGGVWNTVHSALVRALTDRHVDLAKYQRQAAKAKGRPLNADEMLYEIKRLNPDKAAEVKIQEGLRPAIQDVSDDRPWLSVYLTHQDNIDVARVMGAQAERVALAKNLPGYAVQDLQREQARLRMLQQIYPYYASHPTRGPQMSAQIAASQAKIAALDRKVKRLEAARASAAAQTRTDVETNRQFSGGLNVAASRQALADMAAEIGPARMQRIEQAAQQVWDFNRQMLERKRDAGIITPDLFNVLATEYPHYVPTRITDYMKDPLNVPVGKSLSVSDTGLRRNTLEGTVREREDPLASAVRNAYQSEALARKNEAFNAFVKLRDMDPQLQGLIREVPDSYTATRSEAKITGFVGGERKTYAVPKELEAVVKEEPGMVLPGFAGAIWGTMMGAFRAMATSRNPVFLTANATLDAATYAVRESIRAGGPQALPKILAELAAAYADAFRGILSGTYKGNTARFLKGGGGQFGFFQGTPGQARATVEGLSRNSIFTVNSAKDLLRLAGDILTFKPVQGLGERIELAPRVASFHLAERAGANPVKAVINGRTVTMEFTQGGNFAKVVNQFVPFFNVGVQAPVQVVRAFRENPKGFVATAATLLAGPTVVAEAWNRSDPQRAKDYEDVPQYLKDQGVVIMLPGEAPVDANGNRRPQFVHIRLREYAPFAILAREATRRVVGDEPRAWGELIGALAGATSPIQGTSPADVLSSFTPLGVSTGLQLATNEDFFRGRMIATEGGDERASAVSKTIAEALGVRPSQVEFTIRDLATGVGGAALAAGDLAAGKPQQGTGTPQDMPVAGGAYRRFARGDIGDRLARAQQRTVAPDVRATLRAGGVNMEIRPVGSTISRVPLRIAEEERYQVLANQYADENLRRITAIPEWAQFGPDQRTELVQGAIDHARDRAGGEVLQQMGADEIKRRLLSKKAG